MSENSIENLDSLMIGSGSENVSEATPEQIAARAAATAQKMQKLKKDEGHAKQGDKKLAKILSNLSFDELMFVSKLIDYHIPSLTILACISLGKKNLETLCKESVEVIPQMKQQKLPQGIFKNSALGTKIDTWWHHIQVFNKTSKTAHFSDFKNSPEFIKLISEGLAMIVKNFLQSHPDIEYRRDSLEKVLNERGISLFGEK